MHRKENSNVKIGVYEKRTFSTISINGWSRLAKKEKTSLLAGWGRRPNY